MDLVILIDDDEKRPTPASTVLSVWAEEESMRGFDSEMAVGEVHEKLLGGCDFVTIVDSDRPSTAFKPPGTKERSSQLFSLVELCEPDEVLRLILVGDRSSALDLDSKLWNQPVRVDGHTLVTSIPEPGRESLESLQVVALRTLGSSPSGWVSHPVLFAASD